MKKISLLLCILLTALCASITVGDTVSYTYDDAGRLIRAAYSSGKVVVYSYDKAGNLLGRSVTEGGPVCNYTLSAGGQAFPSAGGAGSVNITADPGCAWNAMGAPAWVMLTNPASGSGSGTLNYTVAANAGPDRKGSITIAGIAFTIEQTSASLAGGAVAGSLAHLASAGGWKTTVTLTNTTASAAQVRLSFFNNSGNPLLLPLTFPQSAPGPGPLLASMLDRSINGGATLVIETTGPAQQAVQVGWAQLQTTGGIGGFATFSVTASNQEAVVPLETRNAGSFLLAFDNTASLVTGLAMANVSAQAANVSAIIRDDSGAQLAKSAINLPAHGHTSFLLTQNFAVTAGKRGSVEFDTPPGGQISVLGLRANAPALTTVPVLANVAAGGGTIAQVASSGGWKTTFTFVNTGAAAAQITVDFFDDKGNPLTLPLGFPQTGTNASVSTISRMIAPGASLVVETQGPVAQATVAGWARLTTAGNVGAFAIFRNAATGQEAVVPLETSNAAAYLLVFDNTNGVATGLALANVAGQAASVAVVLRDDTGAVLGTPAINLGAHAHTSFLLTPNYAVSAGKRGTVEFDTPPGGQITAIGLRATPAGTVTTIPVLSK